MPPKFDVLGIGCVTVDDLVFVGAYPAADAKLRVNRIERHFGGLTATALVAAAKLGGKCAFAGLLGEDDLSAAVERNFRDFDIDVAEAVRTADARPIHAVIVVAEEGQTRNVFYEFNAPTGASMAGPSEQAIRDAAVLFVDHIGPEGGLRAAQIAHEARVPIVADFEEIHGPEFDDLYDLIDHLVISEEFAFELTGATDITAALFALWTPDRDTVVVTCGKDGAWFVTRQNRSPQFQPAFKLNAVDTTGCGDVFHGAYALAVARGQSASQRVRFAAAAAGLKATRPGGQAGAPTAEELDRFLNPSTTMENS